MNEPNVNGYDPLPSIGESQEQSTPLVAAGWARVVLFIGASFAALILVALVLVGVLAALGVKVSALSEYAVDLMDRVDTPVAVLIQVGVTVVAVLLVFLFCRFIDRRSMRSLGFDLNRTTRRDLLVGLAWGAGLILIIYAALLLSGQIVIAGIEISWQRIGLVTVALVVMVIQEELIFRAYFLTNLMASMNKYVALALVSTVFALVHGINPNVSWIGVANIVLAGLLLGIYYVHRGNLWFPLGLHFAWNFTQGVVLGVPVSGLGIPSFLSTEIIGSELLTGGEFGFEGSLLATIALAAATLVVHFRYRTK